MNAKIGRINYEKLHESDDADLAVAYAVAIERAHKAPQGHSKDHDGTFSPTGSMAWAYHSREAFRIGNEIARRKGKV